MLRIFSPDLQSPASHCQYWQTQRIWILRLMVTPGSSPALATTLWSQRSMGEPLTSCLKRAEQGWQRWVQQQAFSDPRLAGRIATRRLGDYHRYSRPWMLFCGEASCRVRQRKIQLQRPRLFVVHLFGPSNTSCTSSRTTWKIVEWPLSSPSRGLHGRGTCPKDPSIVLRWWATKNGFSALLQKKQCNSQLWADARPAATSKARP